MNTFKCVVFVLNEIFDFREDENIIVLPENVLY